MVVSKSKRKWELFSKLKKIEKFLKPNEETSTSGSKTRREHLSIFSKEQFQNNSCQIPNNPNKNAAVRPQLATGSPHTWFLQTGYRAET